MALLTALPLAAPASQETVLAGGPGGAKFVDAGPSTARIGAVAIKAGGWIDSIALVREMADGRHTGGKLHGGQGGSVCVIPFEEGEQILAMQGSYGEYVESIQFITTMGVTRICGKPGKRAFRIDVPSGQRVIGIVGRAGDYLDAIGLLLDSAGPPMPRPRAQAPATAPLLPTPGGDEAPILRSTTSAGGKALMNVVLACVVSQGPDFPSYHCGPLKSPPWTQKEGLRCYCDPKAAKAAGFSLGSLAVGKTKFIPPSQIQGPE